MTRNTKLHQSKSTRGKLNPIPTMSTVKEKLEAASSRIRIKRLIKGHLYPDTIGTKKGGNILCRWGYFYSHGKTAEDYVEKVKALLNKHNIAFNIANSGDHWRPFKGGASVASGTHWYVEIKILPTISWPKEVVPDEKQEENLQNEYED